MVMQKRFIFYFFILFLLPVLLLCALLLKDSSFELFLLSYLGAIFVDESKEFSSIFGFWVMFLLDFLGNLRKGQCKVITGCFVSEIYSLFRCPM